MCLCMCVAARLADGDATWVGDRGATLSGGQRARVALARALYQQDCDLYLLDDVLAPVDNACGAVILGALCGPLLRGKTVVAATNSSALLQHADMVVQLRHGQVREYVTCVSSVTCVTCVRACVRANT